MTRLQPSSEQRYLLERHPPTRLKLMRWLAEGRDHKELARVLGVTVNGIRKFRERHLEQIQQIADNMADEFAGILYVQKSQRLIAYQQTIDDCDRTLDELRRAGRVAKLDEEGAEIGSEDISDALARLERTRHRAIRSMAEELGQLPSRMALVVESGKLRHEIVGIDPEKDL